MTKNSNGLGSQNHILVTIVFSQFLCTTLWFAGNAVVTDLIQQFDFPNSSAALFTSSIQLGFIFGTLSYALLSLADRISPSLVFFVSAILAAMSNFIFILPQLELNVAVASRFMTGFFLAGIYPVGMKIAADHFDKSLGKSLGFLVGALILGSAFPHLVKDYLHNFSYQYVIFATSLFSIIGGLAIFTLVPNGPFRKKSQKLQINKTMSAFKSQKFKSAAFGYFGHMWELYAFYAFVPLLIDFYNQKNALMINVPFWSFMIIGVGSIGCFMSGLLSSKFSPKIIATFALATSGLCCLASPLLIGHHNSIIFLGFTLLWGLSIAADSPMFSTLVADQAIPELKGTALTIVNCIGFSLTIISIQLLSILSSDMSFNYIYIILAIGPAFGLYSLWSTKKI